VNRRLYRRAYSPGVRAYGSTRRASGTPLSRLCSEGKEQGTWNGEQAMRESGTQVPPPEEIGSFGPLPAFLLLCSRSRAEGGGPEQVELLAHIPAHAAPHTIILSESAESRLGDTARKSRYGQCQRSPR